MKVTCVCLISLACLAPLLIRVAGQVQATPLLGCPTVLSLAPLRPCERSGQHHARVTRTRVFIYLSYTSKR